MTPQRYLTRLHLLQARHQLCYSDNSVTDIAYLCGFGDSNHFSTYLSASFHSLPVICVASFSRLNCPARKGVKGITVKIEGYHGKNWPFQDNEQVIN